MDAQSDSIARCAFGAAALCCAILFPAESLAAEPPDYHQTIAPFLRQYCAGCHNDADFEGDFSVERFSDVMEGGSKGAPIEPGDPESSLMLRMLTGAAKKQMPPKDEPQPSDDEVAMIREWIASGAPGPAPENDISILASLDVPRIEPWAPVTPPITALAVSPDRAAVALGRPGTIELARTDGESLATLGPIPGKVNALHFSPDGARLVAATGIAGLNGVAVMWDPVSGDKLAEFGDGWHRDILYDAEFSPDGSLLATAGYDRTIAIWDIATGERMRVIDVHQGAVFDLAFSPDGRVLGSASADQTVKLWDVATGERLDTLNQPEGEQFAVVFTPDGEHVLAAGADRRIRMWKFMSRNEPAINPIAHARFAHEDAVTALAVSADGTTLLSAGEDRALKLWSLPDLQQLGVREDEPDVPAAIAFAGAEQALVARMNGSRDVWNVAGLKRHSAASEAAVHADAGPNPAAQMPEAPPVTVTEAELPAEARPIRVSAPAVVNGILSASGEVDEIAFPAAGGASYVIEVDAARSGSPLDSRIEIVDAGGSLVPRVKLQAVRDSWLTFRGKDSSTPDDFRVHNWEEMELNEFLYLNGEVVKLWLYPRGPDSGFKVYPGFGSRQTYFGTTALSHPLGQPCAIVRPYPPGADPPPNGLPVYTIWYENDDDPSRRHGSDSSILFTAPSDGDFTVRVSDVRGFGGSEFRYTLKIRAPRPDFSVRLEGANDLAVSPGGAREFIVKADRFDGFDGEIIVAIDSLPDGFASSAPIVIEAGQRMAAGVVMADADVPALPPDDVAGPISVTASAVVGGRDVTHPVAAPFAGLTLGEPPKPAVVVYPDGQSGDPVTHADGSLAELTIRPGETITAFVRAERNGFEGRIEFGTDDSGRNFPHGIIVANIGLNGLMIPEGDTEQQFAITAAPWVPPASRPIHLRLNNADKQAARPVVLHVVR